MDRETVRSRLLAAGVLLEQWETGVANTFDDFMDEFIKGETVLVGEGASLMRQVWVLSLSVYCTVGGKNFELVEDRQEFADGRVRHRDKKSAVTEKLLPGEDPRLAVARALAEELGLHRFLSCDSQGTRNEVSQSNAFPGLTTEYVLRDYSVELDPADYRPDGYVEVEESTGITTYFVWRAI